VKSGPPNLLCHCVAPYGSRTKDTPEYGCPLALSAVRRPFIKDLLHQFQNGTRCDKCAGTNSLGLATFLYSADDRSYQEAIGKMKPGSKTSTLGAAPKFHDRMTQGGSFSVILKFPKQGDTNHAFDDGPKDVDP